MSNLIVVENTEAPEIFEGWLERGDAIGVFENSDLSSRGMGHTLFIPLDEEEQESFEIGKAHAPDGGHGLGWRYLLKEIVLGLDRFAFKECACSDGGECSG